MRRLRGTYHLDPYDLGENTESLRALFDLSADGMAVCAGPTLVRANQRLVEICGRTRVDALVGQPLDSLLLDIGEGLPDLGRPRPLECELRRADQERRIVSLQPYPLPGAPDRTIWRFRDLTHLRTLEAELFRVNRALRDAEARLAETRDQSRREADDREELLTVVSHELRTPVTVITGYNRLLLLEKAGELNVEQRRFLDEINKSCHRINAFIGNLLETSRSTIADGPVHPRRQPLGPTLEAVVSAMEPLFQERGLHAKLQIDPEATFAEFDADRIEQVLTNLLANAIRYAQPGGGVEVSTRRAMDSESEWVEVAVADDGPGVEDTDRQRIFDAYVRAGSDRRAGGLGLGLAICRRLVRAHGGEISCRERDGGGSVFAFTLRRASADEENGAPYGA